MGRKNGGGAFIPQFLAKWARALMGIGLKTAKI